MPYARRFDDTSLRILKLYKLGILSISNTVSNVNKYLVKISCIF